jgi:K+-transporting ATPase ATPase C chain
MLKTIIRSFVATVILAILVSGVYPLVVTGVGQLLFHGQANGGLIAGADGKIVGARLIGQGFSKPEYFHGRPSAAGDKGYDAANSNGSNLGPTNQKFYDTLKGNIDSVLKDNPSLKKGEVPVDLVTASGSGLDPHISPEAAFVQVERVSAARGMSKDLVKKLVEDHIEGPQLGLLGEAVVNVLMLNMDLDHISRK